jgi:hypothetical protein
MTAKKEDTFGTVSLASSEEISRRTEQVDRLKKTPVPDNELLMNLSLYQRRQDLSHTLFLNEIYQKIVPIHGVVMEFGVRWGRNLATFANLRAIYEPYNYTRRIIGFDTFTGFPSVHKYDGLLLDGSDYKVTQDYQDELKEILYYHECEAPLDHMTKYELIQGDVVQTLPAYFDNHPETIVSFAYMDLDLYEPTKAVLEALYSRMGPGSIITFDELNHKVCPGETVAYNEIMGIDSYKIHRNPMNPCQSWIEL